jgi:isoleucyl-tRNA synthetase
MGRHFLESPDIGNVNQAVAAQNPAQETSSRPDGKFVFPVSDYAGMHVFDANLAIVEHLRATSAFVEQAYASPLPGGIVPILEP